MTDPTNAKDFFDLRVAVDPTTSTALSLGCPTPVPLVVAMYSLLFVAYAARELIVAGVLVKKLRSIPPSLARGRPYLSTVFAYMPTRVLLLDLLLSPILLSCAVLKIANPDGLVLGTDASVTLTMGLGISTLFCCYTDMLLSQFEAVVRPRFMGGPDGARLVHRFIATSLIEVLAYAVAIVVFPAAMLGLNRAPGPISNGQLPLLSLRAAGVIVMFLLRLYNLNMIVREVDALTQSSSGKPPASPRGVGAGDHLVVTPRDAGPVSESTVRVLQFLQHNLAESKRAAMLAIIMYGGFVAIVPLLPFQSVCIGIVVSGTTLNNNTGLILLRAQRAAHATSAAVESTTMSSSPVAKGSPSRSAQKGLGRDVVRSSNVEGASSLVA